MKPLRTLCLLTVLTLPMLRAQEVISLNLSEETVGEALEASRSNELPLNHPDKVVTNDLDSVTVGSTARWGGSEEEKLILIEKNGGSGFVSTTWNWSPFVASAEDALEVSFQLYLAGEGDQGNFMIGLNDTSGTRKMIAYLQISATGNVSMLDTTEEGGRAQPVTQLMPGGVPNSLKLIVNYKDSNVSLSVDDTSTGEPVPFPEGLRVNQIIFYSPGAESIRRTVGLRDIQVRYIGE